MIYVLVALASGAVGFLVGRNLKTLEDDAAKLKAEVAKVETVVKNVNKAL